MPFPYRCIPPRVRAGCKSCGRAGDDPAPERARPDKAAARRFPLSPRCGRLAPNVADDAAEIGLELSQAAISALELLGMGIALVLDQRELADPQVGLAQIDAGSWASRTSSSRARFNSLASVGNITAWV